MDFQEGMFWKMSFPGLTFESRKASYLHTFSHIGLEGLLDDVWLGSIGKKHG